MGRNWCLSVNLCNGIRKSNVQSVSCENASWKKEEATLTGSGKTRKSAKRYETIEAMTMGCDARLHATSFVVVQIYLNIPLTCPILSNGFVSLRLYFFRASILFSLTRFVFLRLAMFFLLANSSVFLVAFFTVNIKPI